MTTIAQTDNAMAGEQMPAAKVVSQSAPWGGSESWATCEACGWRSANYTRRPDAEAEGAAHRCAPALDNQGAPVHGDKVGYHAARRDLLGGER
jgi:hypothetical protein